MSRGIMCNCKEQPELIGLPNNYEGFKSKLNQQDVGSLVLLMSCPDCNQLWKVDEWNEYEACYAVKISSQENWEAFDSEILIKEQMIKNRGGLSQKYCMWLKCDSKQVKGGTFCVDHLWITGSRT